MSGLILPLPEPPAPDVHRLLTQLRIARASLEVARDRAARVAEWANEPDLTWPDDMMLRILDQVRGREVALWAQEVAKLELQAHTMGLHP